MFAHTRASDDPEDPTGQAADLAERMLDEISSANQDWRVVAACARDLAELADRAARPRPDDLERGDR